MKWERWYSAHHHSIHGVHGDQKMSRSFGLFFSSPGSWCRWTTRWTWDVKDVFMDPKYTEYHGILTTIDTYWHDEKSFNRRFETRRHDEWSIFRLEAVDSPWKPRRDRPTGPPQGWAKGSMLMCKKQQDESTIYIKYISSIYITYQSTVAASCCYLWSL